MRLYLCIHIIFYSLVWVCIITLFDVRKKLNNHILQCPDLKFIYGIEPLQIECHIIESFDVLFSKCNKKITDICIAITFYDKCMKSNNHILKWCNLEMHVRNQDITWYKIWKHLFPILLETCHFTPCAVNGYKWTIYILICTYSLWYYMSNGGISF